MSNVRIEFDYEKKYEGVPNVGCSMAEYELTEAEAIRVLKQIHAYIPVGKAVGKGLSMEYMHPTTRANLHELRAQKEIAILKRDIEQPVGKAVESNLCATEVQAMAEANERKFKLERLTQERDILNLEYEILNLEHKIKGRKAGK